MALALGCAHAALAQNTPIMGEVKTFAGNFCPRDWMPADGRTLKIHDHTALFALLGTVYGGDGKQTFALPDLRGRKTVGARGAGKGRPQPGQKGGAENVHLTVNNAGPHAHGFTAKTDGQVEGSPAGGNTNNPDGALISIPDGVTAFGQDTKNLVNMAGASVVLDYTGQTQNSGKGKAFPILDPSLALTICVSAYGTFPLKP